MNAMKKWVVAGLIGLSSVGMALAAPDLDVNDAIWGDYGGPASINAAYPTPLAPAPIYASDTVSYLYAKIMGGSTTARNGGATISGSALTMEFHKTAAGAQGGIETYAIYDLNALNLNGADYSGITLNFQAAANSFLNNYGTYNLVLDYSDAEYNPLTATMNLKNHNSGLVPLLWTSTDWDVGAIENIAFINKITIYYYLVGSASTPNNGGFTDVFNSITLDGVNGVPEPETVWMMLAVLGSLAVTFRGQLSDLARRFVKS